MTRPTGPYLYRKVPAFPDAECSKHPDLHWTHPDDGPRSEVGRMLLICCACRHLLGCREWAVRRGETGIWGATTDEDRAAIRQRARA